MIDRRWWLLLGVALLSGCAGEPRTSTTGASTTGASTTGTSATGTTATGTSTTGTAGGTTAAGGVTSQGPAQNFRLLNQTSCPTEASSYGDWVARFQSYAVNQGKRPDMIQLAFATVKENPSISASAGKQPEFVTPVWTYMSKAVSPSRIAKGQQKYAENAAAIEAVSRDYNVPASVMMGIWGLETDFGGNFGDINVFEALSNLGYRANRAPFACKELLAALDIVDAGHIKPSQMIGSWAGAMGHSQFLPSNYLSVAVDREGTGAPDLWNSMPDVFASTANMLNRDGWEQGQPWGVEVKLPAKFPYGEAELDVQKPLAYWQGLGVKTIDGTPLPPLTGGTSILLLAGYKGPAFLVGQNFRTILKYNYSTSYALSVAYLGDQIRGGRGVVSPWPVNDPQLNLNERIEVQELLERRGYDAGGADGILGLKSRKAARQFQREIGWPQDGYITKALLAELRKRMVS